MAVFILINIPNVLSAQADSTKIRNTQCLCDHVWRFSEYSYDTVQYWISKGVDFNYKCKLEKSRLRLGKLAGKLAKKYLLNQKYIDTSPEYKHYDVELTPFEAAYKYEKMYRRLSELIRAWKENEIENSRNPIFNFPVKDQIAYEGPGYLLDTIISLGATYEGYNLNKHSDFASMKKLADLGADWNTVNIRKCAQRLSCKDLTYLFQNHINIDSIKLDFDEYFGAGPTRQYDTSCLRKNGFDIANLEGEIFFAKKDTGLVKYMIQQGVTPNIGINKAVFDFVPLGFMLINNNENDLSNLKFLVEHGFDIDQEMQVKNPTEYGKIRCSPFIYTMLLQDKSRYEFLKSREPDVNRRFYIGKRAIHFAIDNNDLHAAKDLYKMGAHFYSRSFNLKKYTEVRKSKISPELYEFIMQTIKLDKKRYRKERKR